MKSEQSARVSLSGAAAAAGDRDRDSGGGRVAGAAEKVIGRRATSVCPWELNQS